MLQLRVVLFAWLAFSSLEGCSSKDSLRGSFRLHGGLFAQLRGGFLARLGGCLHEPGFGCRFFDRRFERRFSRRFISCRMGSQSWLAPRIFLAGR